jgi:hypothetical protein
MQTQISIKISILMIKLIAFFLILIFQSYATTSLLSWKSPSTIIFGLEIKDIWTHGKVQSMIKTGQEYPTIYDFELGKHNNILIRIKYFMIPFSNTLNFTNYFVIDHLSFLPVFQNGNVIWKIDKVEYKIAHDHAIGTIPITNKHLRGSSIAITSDKSTFIHDQLIDNLLRMYKVEKNLPYATEYEIDLMIYINQFQSILPNSLQNQS